MMNLTTKEKLVKVTMDIIAEEGLHNLTNRKIASKAGLNSAAINYHFGSQGALIDEALKTMTDQLREAYLNLQDSNEAIEIKLKVFIQKFIEISYKYPAIIKNTVDRLIHETPFDYYSDWMLFIQNQGIDIVKQTIMQLKPDSDENIAYLKTLHLLSCLSFPFLMGERLEQIMKVDLSNKQIREMYENLILNLFVK